MEAAASAIGIASLGIQACQGLLSYYNDWKGYKQEITRTYESIGSLGGSLAQLLPFLQDTQLDKDKRETVIRSLQSCEHAVSKLHKKLQKLRTYDKPEGARQRAWAEIQRACYPFRTSTLAKLQEVVDDARNRLQLALSALHLDVGVKSHAILTQLAEDVQDITTSVACVSAQSQRILEAQHSSDFKKIVDWLSPPDPWTNHATARRHHYARTGQWLVDSEVYQRWRNGTTRHLWLKGKPGCGKTILCSTVIEDVRSYCQNLQGAASAVFYFSFADDRKQGARDLLLSLAAQLCWQEPGISALRHAYEQNDSRVPGSDEMESMVVSSIRSFNDVYIMLDALDESPETGDARQSVLEVLGRLTIEATQLKIFATSREVRSIAAAMRTLRADILAADTRAVDTDIRSYVAKELSQHHRLSQWDNAIRDVVEDALSAKASGM